MIIESPEVLQRVSLVHQTASAMTFDLPVPNVVHFLCQDGEPLGWVSSGEGRIYSPEAPQLLLLLP